MVYGFPSRFSFLVISLLYFVQGVGVAYFIRKREGGLRLSRASDQLKLGFPLIGFNLAMGLMGLAYSHPDWFAHRHSFDVTGLLMEGSLLRYRSLSS